MKAEQFFSLLYPSPPESAWLTIWGKSSRKETHCYPATLAGFEEAARKAAELDADGANVYFGLGLRKEKLSPKKRGTWKEVVAIPGFWAEVDCRGGCHAVSDERLPGKDEAREFLLALPVPPSLVVDSGGGLHAYWLFNEPWVLPDGAESRPHFHREEAALQSEHFQKALKALFAARGWHLDNTSDLARVLRVPGTHNRKDPENPRPVEVIYTSEKRYTREEIAWWVTAVLATQAQERRTQKPSFDGDGEKPDARAILERCAFLRHCRDDAATLSEPEWYAMLTIMARTDGGPELCHELSRPYPRYSERETEQKIRHALEDTGPLTCARIRQDFGQWCRECPHDVTSPILLGRRPRNPLAGTGPIHEGSGYTDLDNAVRLVERHGSDLRYCWPWKKWLVWDGRRWKIDDTAEVARRAKETVRAMVVEAAALEDEKARKAALHAALRCQTRHRLDAMINLAASEPGVPVLPAQLDRDPWLLNVLNGTLDLRTGELRPHRREDLLTKLAPVEYDPEATCPRWERFLREIMAGNENLIAFLRRAVGMSLTGDTSEHVLLILYGTGRNGKSTFLNTLLALLGDYACQAAPDLLMTKNTDRHPTELADLFGKRLVASIESEEGRRLAESLVKQLTGGDKIKARRMREDFWEFWPTHKLWLATNHKPQIRGTDIAIWSRLKLIPFMVTFREEEQDKRLPQRLLAELPGILRWAVEGCLEWQRDGLDVPEEVKTATAAYREEQDILAGFLEECCARGAGLKASAKDLYAAYCSWCEENGERAVSQRRFGMQLAERGFERRRGTRGAIWWHGLGLLVNEEVNEVNESERTSGMNEANRSYKRLTGKVVHYRSLCSLDEKPENAELYMGELGRGEV